MSEFGRWRQAKEFLFAVFHTLNAGIPGNSAQAREFIERIKASKPFQGNGSFDLIAVGEIIMDRFTGTIISTTSRHPTRISPLAKKS